MNMTFLPYLVFMPALIKLEPSVLNSSINLQAASVSVSLSSFKRLFVTSVDVLKLAKWHANSKLAGWTYDEASNRWQLWCSVGFIYCFCPSCLFFKCLPVFCRWSSSLRRQLQMFIQCTMIVGDQVLDHQCSYYWQALEMHLWCSHWHDMTWPWSHWSS